MPSLQSFGNWYRRARAVAGLAVGLLLWRGLPVAAADPVEFNRDIRPLLADNCFHCHGPDPGTRKAGLRLDTEAGFFAPRVDKKGKEEPPTVIKGQPDKSSLYLRMLSKDEDEVMPPPVMMMPLVDTSATSSGGVRSRTE